MLRPILYASVFLFSLSQSASATVTDQPSEPVIGAPADGSCSNATADFRFTAWYYKGGARPFPGMITAETKAVYRDEVIGRSITQAEGEFFDEGAEPQVDGNVPWKYTLNFDARSKRILERSGNSVRGTETWAQKVTLVPRTLMTGEPDTKPISIRVICERSWDLPRP